MLQTITTTFVKAEIGDLEDKINEHYAYGFVDGMKYISEIHGVKLSKEFLDKQYEKEI